MFKKKVRSVREVYDDSVKEVTAIGEHHKNEVARLETEIAEREAKKEAAISEISMVKKSVEGFAKLFGIETSEGEKSE